MIMSMLRDKFWIWGHPAGSHDNTGWGLDGLHSRMTPCECAWYLGIPNVIMVCYNDNPKPPFEQEALALDCLRETIWSLVGNSRSNPNADSLGNLEEVLKIAGTHPNITGTMFDDFFSHGRDQVYTPEILKTIRSRLQNAPGGPLDMWVVVYDYVLDHPMQQHLEHFDGVTYWTWVGKDLSLFDANFAKLKQVAKGKRIMLGCYLYDYGKAKKTGVKQELTVEDMRFQLERYAQTVRDGEAEGIILLSNTVADLGFEAVEYTKQWLQEHGDEPV